MTRPNINEAVEFSFLKYTVWVPNISRGNVPTIKKLRVILESGLPVLRMERTTHKIEHFDYTTSQWTPGRGSNA